MKPKFIILVVIGLLAGLALAASANAATRQSLLAPVSVCPDQTASSAPVGVQEEAMRCLTNFARQRAGLPTLAPADALDRSAGSKSADIVRCDNFSHEACGREFTYWMQRFGYLRGGCWKAGENIAWGNGDRGTVRSIFDAWMHSPGHRKNILGDYAQIGIGLQVGGLDGYSGAHVWTQEFGSHC